MLHAQDKAKGDASGASPATSSNPNRLIVFILGSVGYNELRTAYEVSQRYGLDVIIGSHNLASPVQFLTQLEHLEEQRAGQVGGVTVRAVASLLRCATVGLSVRNTCTRTAANSCSS